MSAGALVPQANATPVSLILSGRLVAANAAAFVATHERQGLAIVQPFSTVTVDGSRDGRATERRRSSRNRTILALSCLHPNESAWKQKRPAG
jgi:hypothetical protein